MSHNPFAIAFEQLSRTPPEVRRRQRHTRRPRLRTTTRPSPGHRGE
jgi:hypothetical protein